MKSLILFSAITMFANVNARPYSTSNTESSALLSKLSDRGTAINLFVNASMCALKNFDLSTQRVIDDVYSAVENSQFISTDERKQYQSLQKKYANDPVSKINAIAPAITKQQSTDKKVMILSLKNSLNDLREKLNTDMQLHVDALIEVLGNVEAVMQHKIYGVGPFWLNFSAANPPQFDHENFASVNSANKLLVYVTDHEHAHHLNNEDYSPVIAAFAQLLINADQNADIFHEKACLMSPFLKTAFNFALFGVSVGIGYAAVSSPSTNSSFDNSGNQTNATNTTANTTNTSVTNGTNVSYSLAFAQDYATNDALSCNFTPASMHANAVINATAMGACLRAGIEAYKTANPGMFNGTDWFNRTVRGDAVRYATKVCNSTVLSVSDNNLFNSYFGIVGTLIASMNLNTLTNFHADVVKNTEKVMNIAFRGGFNHNSNAGSFNFKKTTDVFGLITSSVANVVNFDPTVSVTPQSFDPSGNLSKIGKCFFDNALSLNISEPFNLTGYLFDNASWVKIRPKFEVINPNITNMTEVALNCTGNYSSATLISMLPNISSWIFKELVVRGNIAKSPATMNLFLSTLMGTQVTKYLFKKLNPFASDATILINPIPPYSIASYNFDFTASQLAQNFGMEYIAKKTPLMINGMRIECAVPMTDQTYNGYVYFTNVQNFTTNNISPALLLDFCKLFYNVTMSYQGNPPRKSLPFNMTNFSGDMSTLGVLSEPNNATLIWLYSGYINNGKTNYYGQQLPSTGNLGGFKELSEMKFGIPFTETYDIMRCNGQM